MKCEIIKDLLPSYIDHLTSNESNEEIELHLAECSECKLVYEQMQSELHHEEIEINTEKIKPFKKLKQKNIRVVLITSLTCIALIRIYLFFFGFGWKVDSNDLDMTYTYEEGEIIFEFELTNNRVLNYWNNRDTPALYGIITFTECFASPIDDRGKHPNRFTYGIHCLDETGTIKDFDENDSFIIYYKDNVTETIYLEDIVNELGLSK